MLSVRDSTRGHLPLLIGATGHRDLRTADRPVLEQTIRRAIEELRDQCPHTPLIVLSALAEGADRLVARAALDLGFSLIVALPMPQAEYEKDFDKPGSLDEFQALLGQAKWRFVVAEAENIKRIGESIQAGDSTLAQKQLRDLGKEALNESADWVLLHRERPLEVPSAG